MFWIASVVHGLMVAPLLTLTILGGVTAGLYVLGVRARTRQ